MHNPQLSDIIETVEKAVLPSLHKNTSFPHGKYHTYHKAEIFYRMYHNTEGNLLMKKPQAILLVSFGTNYPDSKETTIDKLLEKTMDQFPDCQIYQAWTSKTLIRILKEQNGLAIPTIEEAMMSIKSASIETLTIQPTHLINGLENEKMEQLVRLHASPSLNLRFGVPLLAFTEDHKAVLQTTIREFS